jgi:hypothetical protein
LSVLGHMGGSTAAHQVCMSKAHAHFRRRARGKEWRMSGVVLDDDDNEWGAAAAVSVGVANVDKMGRCTRGCP